MRAAILRSGILLTLAALGASAATAQTELFFATGVDSTGWALARSNTDGHVLIESPQYPRGLWLHLVDEAGDALAGLQVEYQGRLDSLVAIHCVDPTGGVRETLIWSRAEGDPLRLILKSKEAADLPAGLAPIDWQIDPTAASLLEPVTEWLIGWEAVAPLLWERWKGWTGRVAIQLYASTRTSFAVELDHPETIETLMAHLQQTQRPTAATLRGITPLKVQIFEESFDLRESVILYIRLFEDANLERVVREALRRPRLTLEDVASLTWLWADSKNIHSLIGLEYLTSLQVLSLGRNQIADITPLTALKNLQQLSLDNNQIADITPLANLTNLSSLGLSGNQIVDLTPMKQLTNLNELYMNINQIVDLTPMKQLTNLGQLHLSDNQIADITPLTALKNLQQLSLDSNQIVDLPPLNQLSNLGQLHLSDNQIADITPLTALKNLQRLDLDNSQIVDLAPLNQLNNLGRLHLSDNQIVDITPLTALKNLESLYLSHNQIVDITPLASLTRLHWLILDDNLIKDLAPLVSNIGLGGKDKVNVENNPLSDQALNEQIPALKARGVSVEY